MVAEETPRDAVLARGRERFAAWDWRAAHDAFIEADRAEALAPEDLERLSTAAYMLGRVDLMIDSLERAHHGYLEIDEPRPAARTALWLGTNLASRGKMGPAGGWLKRAHRILETDDEDCVERGYLLMPEFFKHEAMGDFAAMAAVAENAAAIGRRFGDPDLVALSAHTQGRALVRLGRTDEGLALLDEVMIDVTAGELSPMVTGIVYCSVIEGCYEVQEIRRAREWTAELSDWCDEQPDLVAFTGQCLAHRAEIMQLQGRWDEALEEARSALERGARGLIAAQAHYQRGEIHRLRGEHEEAEEAYRSVSRSGGDPHPGLARLRMAQGNEDAAVAAIRRAAAEANSILDKARLLPAYVDVMRAAGDQSAATDASKELAAIAEQTGVDLHVATATFAEGACHLMEDDSRGALGALRTALLKWHDLGVPYELARTRELIGSCLETLQDRDTAALEYEAARAAFSELGARPDVARLERSIDTDGRSDHGLTSRELEVLRLLTQGNTNRSIAEELVLSERTIDRHVSNIYTKLGVSSRSAATAYAYEHDLL